MKQYGITTRDNPYNQFTQFSEWLLFDKTKGYNTLEYLARVAHTSESLSEAENQTIVKEAIEDMLRLDFMNIYVMVHREVDYLGQAIDDSSVQPEQQVSN